VATPASGPSILRGVPGDTWALHLTVCLALALAVGARADAPHVVRGAFCDAARDRVVPVKVVLPRGPGPFPVVVFSHGLGATREAYAYLGERWARAGLATVYLQHAGTDSGIFRGRVDRKAAMKAAVADAENLHARPRDVAFVIDRLAALARTSPSLRGKLDLARIGVAGHSLGAWTSLVTAGQRAGAPLADPRPRAVAALSAPVGLARGDRALTFGGVRIPLILMTGTLDVSPIADCTPAERRIPYDHAGSPEKLLVVFAGGDHWIFSGRGYKRAPLASDLRFQELIAEATAAFWRAYLRGDDGARAWLHGGGLRAALGRSDVVESRSAQRLRR
jgi:predicted dienelactone hydrolase